MKAKEVIGLLPKDFRRRGLRMAAAVGVRVVLDLAGLAALVSALLLLLTRDGGQRYVWAVLAAGAAVLLLKNAAVLLLERWQGRQAMALYRHLSARLLRSYYARGLTYVRSEGASALTYRVNAVCYAFVIQVVLPALRMAGEGVLLAVVMAALMVYDWRTTLVLTACLAPLMWACLRAMRRRLDRYGRDEDEAKRRQWEVVHEAFRGYAEVEIYQAFPLVCRRFGEGLRDISRGREQVEMLQRVPPALLETGMMAGLIVLLLMDGTGEGLRTTLGVFGVAAFRMLPGVRSLMGCWIQIRNSMYTTNIIAEALHDDAPATATQPAARTTEEQDEAGAATKPASDGLRPGTCPAKGQDGIRDSACTAEPAPDDDKAPAPEDTSAPDILPLRRELRLDRITFAYGDGPAVLRDFSLTVRPGACIGIQGISGAGKSTLFNLILGFLRPQQGSITVDGCPLTPLNSRAWRAGLGYVPQEVFIAGASLAENVALGCEPARIDRHRVRDVLEQVQLTEWTATLPAGPDTPLGENGCRLSGGQKQRIGIARALYKDAHVLLLDEPTSSLDTDTEAGILQVIHRLPLHRPDLTLLIISHRESALNGCSQIIRLGDGK